MTSNIDEGDVHLGNPQDNIIKISLISVKHNIGFKIQNSSFEKGYGISKDHRIGYAVYMQLDNYEHTGTTLQRIIFQSYDEYHVLKRKKEKTYYL